MKYKLIKKAWECSADFEAPWFHQNEIVYAEKRSEAIIEVLKLQRKLLNNLKTRETK